MKRLGPMFVVAIAMHVAGVIVWLATTFATMDYPGESIQRWWLTMHGCHVASNALFAAGLFELARRRSGAVRTGMWIAATLAVASMGLGEIMRWMSALKHDDSMLTISKIWSYVAPLMSIALAGSLALAMSRKRALAIAGVALAVVSRPLPVVDKVVFKPLAAGVVGHQRVMAVLSLVYIAGIALLLFAACDGERPADGRLAMRGLGRVGSALLLRVFASLIGSGLLILLLMGGSGGEGSLEVLRVAMMAAAVVNVVAQVVMTIGMLEAGAAGYRELSPWALAIAAACAAWVTGVLLDQLGGLYDMLYGHGHVSHADRDLAMPLSTTIPLLVTASVGIVAGTIGAYAGRRGLEELRNHASGKGVGFVVLMLASLGITSWIVPEARSVGGLAIMLVCALIAAISAHLMGARLCALAARSIDAQPELPSARVVGG